MHSLYFLTLPPTHLPPTGGIVGISIFRYLALASIPAHLLTISPTLYTTLTSRNSAVLHTGMHGPSQTSNKVKWCKEGREMIEDFARAKGVRLEKTGKIMVANDEDGERRLEEFKRLPGGEGLIYKPPSFSSTRRPYSPSSSPPPPSQSSRSPRSSCPFSLPRVPNKFQSSLSLS